MALRPACAYIGLSDAIFLGRVSFTNDDSSGTFTQATLVRFDVEEAFKGISPGTKQVWADPGSFTTYYEEYHLGERYLIFAQRRQSPGDSAAMTFVTGGTNSKLLPPGIDPANPPVVYWAPECSGSRPADRFPHIEMDLAMLRAYRDGQSLPRVFGWVYLEPFKPWPWLNGPQLNGARVTLTNGKTVLRTTTRSDGSFVLADAPAGLYSVDAELPPFVPVWPKTILTVPEAGCGSRDIALRTTSELSGVVVDTAGLPVAQVPVKVEVLADTHGNTFHEAADLYARTDAEGRFAIMGIPDNNIRLSYGSDYPSSNELRYLRVYYPDSISPSQAGPLRLKVGERRELLLRLRAPLKIGHIRVKVLKPDGGAASGAFANARLDGVITESEKTDTEGTAELPCLEGLQYQLEPYVQIRPLPGLHVIRGRSVSMVCGKDRGPFALTLDREESLKH